MTYFAVCCLLAAYPALAAEPKDPVPASLLLRSVESRYNHAQSLTLSFSETYAGSRRPAQTEAGTLFLRKPGRMRWDYSTPAGKVFLSDGKDVYLYTPEDHRAEKSKLKESDDMRAPLAFLLGKLDFAKEFRTLAVKNEGPDAWIVAEPKSLNLAYTKVEFLALPSGEIRRVRVTGQDHSQLEFTFSDERLNAPVSADLFSFRPPPGVSITSAGSADQTGQAQR